MLNEVDGRLSDLFVEFVIFIFEISLKLEIRLPDVMNVVLIVLEISVLGGRRFMLPL